jgi:MYXO-CTERM domain-containing protein
MLSTRARRFISEYQPVGLGQTRTGYVLAAALVALWMVERPVAAEAVWGANENQHIRIEWFYFWEPNHYESTVLFQLKDDPTDGLRPLALREVRFYTLGLPFEQQWLSESWTLEGPYSVGVLGGQTLYEYTCLGPSATPVDHYALSAIGRWRSEGAGLFNTQASYTIAVTPDDGSGGGWSVNGTLDFVSVQAIPEPPSAALGLFAAVAGAVGRRRRNPWQNKRGKAE